MANEQVADKLRWFREVIKDMRVAMVTTRSRDGGMHSRPLTTLEVEFAGALWFLTRESSSQVEDVRTTGRVNLSYAAPGGMRYASVSGTAEIVRDAEKARELWKAEYAAWFPKGPTDTELSLLKVNVEKVEYWDSPLNPIAQLVEFVGGTPSPIRVATVPPISPDDTLRDVAPVSDAHAQAHARVRGDDAMVGRT